MRTTLDIEDDLLQAAKEIARRERTSAGHVVSRLLRSALTQPRVPDAGPSKEQAIGGFRPFTSPSGKVVTNENVDHLRDQEGI